MARIRASLRIMGKDLDPQEVSALLKLEPDEAHKRGDPRPGAKKGHSPYSEGLWCRHSRRDESATVAQHISALLEDTAGQGRELASLRAKGFELDLFIGVMIDGGNSDFQLPPALMERLAEFGLELAFDVYASG